MPLWVFHPALVWHEPQLSYQVLHWPTAHGISPWKSWLGWSLMTMAWASQLDEKKIQQKGWSIVKVDTFALPEANKKNLFFLCVFVFTRKLKICKFQNRQTIQDQRGVRTCSKITTLEQPYIIKQIEFNVHAYQIAFPPCSVKVSFKLLMVQTPLFKWPLILKKLYFDEKK